MNWISKFIKPKIKSLFKKKTSSSEETLWISCECKNLIYKDVLNVGLIIKFHVKIGFECSLTTVYSKL